VSVLLSVLKLIIHTKRFITAFFVIVLVKPIAWVARLIFDTILVPGYRLYVLLGKKIASPQELPGSSRLSHFLHGRLTIHMLVIAVAVVIAGGNLIFDTGVVSSDELVGKTKLSLLVSDESVESGQLIEDYPNLEIARLERRQIKDRATLDPDYTIFTKESPPEAAPEKPSERTDTIVYTVEAGDTISRIANKFGISINTILWENDLRATSVIKPGNQLRILPTSGIAHTVTRGQTLGQIARLYDIDESKILETNGLSNPNQIAAGAKLIIPGGSQLASASPAQTVNRQVSTSLKQIITDKKSASVIPAGGRMVWPTAGYRITQYYSWRHTGVDIANKIGTPIYAADSGVVTSVGYNRGGYGNQIIIDHGGGKQTRYAHLSSFDVKTGNRVTKGQYIGAMGSTGRSTGPHLHFEVMINGARYNPLNYVR